jgi:chromosome segregation ATPase
MSRVNLESAQNNIERLSGNLNELQQMLSSKNAELSAKIREFGDVLSSFFSEADEKNQLFSKEEERKVRNNEELDQLNGKLQELTSRKDILQSEITSKQRDIEQISALVLEREKINTEASLQVDSLNDRIANFNRKIEEFDVLTNALVEETKDQTRTLEIKNAELTEQYNRIVSRSKSLQYLIKKDIVTLPEIQVIRSLNTPGIDTLDNLRKTSGVSEEIIRKILQDLARREVVAYDPNTGKIQILSRIDI